MASTALLIVAAQVTGAFAHGPLPTPNDADIPTPVPVEMSLAGASTPDISRFLNVRTAAGTSTTLAIASFSDKSRRSLTLAMLVPRR